MGRKLTGTPGIAEKDEFPAQASPPLALLGRKQLEPVAAHRGRGWRGDEHGGSVGIQALQLQVGLPAAGGHLLGEGDRHHHVVPPWNEERQ